MALPQGAGHAGKNDVTPGNAGIRNRPVGRCLFAALEPGLCRNDDGNTGSFVKVKHYSEVTGGGTVGKGIRSGGATE